MITYDREKDFGGKIWSTELSPRITLKICILEMRDFISGFGYLSGKTRKFIESFRPGDIVVIEYPIFLNSRTKASLYSFKIGITNERMGVSEEIEASKIEYFWESVNKFSIIKD